MGPAQAASAHQGQPPASTPASEESAMTDPDSPYSANGSEQRAELRAMPFFPAPPGSAPGSLQSAPVTVPPPLPTPEMPTMTGEMTATRRPVTEEAQEQETGRSPFVKGRIKIEDEVVEKIAGMAALEVNGVAALGGGDASRTVDAVRDRIGMSDTHSHRGVKARVTDNEINLDLVIVVEYGSIVIEVAKVVKNNVARVVGMMLGMRVSTVNVTVDDVRMPGEERQTSA
jgi:uncharacterized alkaline shock family protein YloU